MRFQKGQSIVEFTLLLPLFLLFIFAIVYFSMIFLDYMTLSTVARNSAREASVVESATEYANGYPTIRKHYEDKRLPAAIYDWDPTSESDFKIDYKPSQDASEHGNVMVTVNAKLNDDGSWLAGIIDGLTDHKDTSKLDLHITCTMYSEDNWKTQK